MKIEGSGSVPLTIGSGSGSRRPNNTAFHVLFSPIFLFIIRRRADDGSGGSESDLSEEDEDTPTTTRSDHSLASSSEEDDLSEDEEDLFFSDSSSEEEGEDVVVEEEEEARDLEAVLEAAQGTRVLPALWLSCIWLRAQPEVLAGMNSLRSILCAMSRGLSASQCSGSRFIDSGSGSSILG